MSATKRAPIRFSLLTALVWLVVAAGIIYLLWQVITHISTNQLPVSTTAPNMTQVDWTIAAILTAQQTSQTTIVHPTSSLTPTSSVMVTPSTPQPSPKVTSTPAAGGQTATPAALCDQAAAGNPIDVTIPDDSIIAPGLSFVKTWKLVNTGTCTWTTLYTVSFFYGDRMGATNPVPLPETVLPSQSVEVSVDLVAPETPGTYQGNWKLSNMSGVLFGIGPNGDSAFWVRITVAGAPTNTPTVVEVVIPTATSANLPTNSATPTPAGQVSGELTPAPGDTIDLDTLTLNSAGADLAYQVDQQKYHWLSPQPGTMIGVYSSLEPSLSECQTAAMSSAPIAVESLSTGTYLCYTTNQGRLGRALLVKVTPDSFVLNLDLLTWALP